MIPHTAIPVTNLERSITFYERLGFARGKSWERPEWKMSGGFMHHPSGLNIELIVHPENENISGPKVREVLHIAIPVADLQHKFQEITSAGVTVIRPISAGLTVKQLAFIADPDGFTIELFEPKE